MKKITAAWIFVFLIVINSAYAFMNKENYVNPIDNTDNCLVDCYTIYEITAADRDIILTPNVDYKTLTNPIKRNWTEVPEITSIRYYRSAIEEYQAIIGYSNETYDCTNESVHNSSMTSPCIRQNPIYGAATREIFANFSGPFILSEGQSVKLKIEGRKKPNASVDNIFNLKLKSQLSKFELIDRTYSYDEYAWWNSSWTYKSTLSGFTSNGEVGCFDEKADIGYYQKNSTRVIENDSTEIAFAWNYTIEDGVGERGDYGGGDTSVLYISTNFTADSSYYPVEAGYWVLEPSGSGGCWVTLASISIHKYLGGGYFSRDPICYGTNGQSLYFKQGEEGKINTTLRCRYRLEQGEKYMFFINHTQGCPKKSATSDVNPDGAYFSGLSVYNDTTFRFSIIGGGPDLRFYINGSTNNTEKICFYGNQGSTYNVYYNASPTVIPQIYQWNTYSGWDNRVFDINGSATQETLSIGYPEKENQKPTHPNMYVNMTKVWNQSGEFSGPATIENFEDKMNNSLGSCIPTGNYCDIPLNFSSLTSGILEISNININYTITDTEAPKINTITATNPVQASGTISLTINATDNVNVTEVTAAISSQFTNLTYNPGTGLWEGSMTAPAEPGNYSLNLTARDWVDLIQKNTTTEAVYYAGKELVILPGDVTYTPSEAIEKEQVAIDVVVRNTGNEASGDFTLAFKVNGTLNDSMIISVPAESSKTEQFAWASPYGNYEISIVADSAANVTEGNESNNEGEIQINLNDATPPVIHEVIAEPVLETSPLQIKANVTDNAGVSEVLAEINGQIINLAYNATTQLYENSTNLNNGVYTMKITAIDINGISSATQKEAIIYDSLPDLTIRKQDITFSQQPLADGINTIIYATVHNNGGINTSDFIVELNVDGISMQNTTLSVMAMSENTTSFSWNPIYGNRTLTIRTDVLNDIPNEANESNNDAEKLIDVFDMTPPIIHSHIISNPVYAGSTINITVNVTDNVIVTKVNATISATSANLNNVSGNEIWQGSLTAPAAGDYVINITALDGSGLYTVKHIPITVYSTIPDLVIGPLDLLLTPSNISEPQTLYVNVTVHNTGGSNSGNFDVGLEINNVSVDSTTMSVGAASENMIQLSWASDYGEKNPTVKVDTGGAVTETNESNNQANKPIFVPDMTPPAAPSLSSSPDNWTDQTTHTISWSALSDTNGINNYEYQIDYGDWVSIGLNTSFTTPSQTEGIHMVYVRGIDVPGNKGDIGNATLYIDASNPGTPSIKEWHCGNNWTMHSSPYFTWEDPGDTGSSVKDYFGSMNNGTPFSLNSSLVYHPNLTTGYYEFRVYAEDYLDHSSSWSNASIVFIDITKPLPPVINSTTHPDNATWYSNNIAQFNFTGPADDSSIAGYYYTISDIINGTVDDASFWTANKTFNVTNLFGGMGITNETEDMRLPDGTWYILAISLDGAGNLGEVNSSFMFKIDTTAPAVYNLTPAQDSIVSDEMPLIKALYLDSGSGIKNSSVSLFLDGQNTTPFINESSAYYTPTAPLSNGTHTANIYVEDNLGHVTNVTWSFAILTKNLETWLDKYEYYRPSNELVNIHANYTYSGGAPVEGALVTAEIRKPNGTTYLNLTEGQPGIYSNNYPITNGDWTGNVTIIITAEDDTAVTSYFLSPEWWNSSWHFRVPLTINLDNNRTNALVESTIDLGKLLNNINYSSIEQNSIRIIDHESGQKLNENYDFINDTAADILYRMNGLFYTGQNKTYWVYFDATDNGEKPIEMTYFEGAWKANEFYLYTNDYADMFCYEDNCSIKIWNATNWQLLKEKNLSRSQWYTYPETRSINNTILYINSTKPISVLSRTLNVNVTGTEDEVYSLKGKEFFTLVQKNLWITSYNNSNQIIIQDLSDGDDNHSITLNKGGNINYTDFDGDLIHINSTSDITIVAGYEDDNVITAVFGENNKDYYTPIFGVLYIVGMYTNTIINVTDINGGQGNWYGTLNKSQKKELDFGVNVQIGNGPEFEWGEIHANKPILVLIQAAGVGGTDALGQFFVPDIVTSSVGRKYVTFGPRTASGYYYNWSYDVIATENNTKVDLTGNITNSFTLNTGQRYRYNLSYNDTVEVKASKRVSVDAVFQRVEAIDQEGYTAVAGKEFSFEENTLGALDILLGINFSTDKAAYSNGDTIHINETVLVGKGRVCEADISSYINRSNSTTSALSLNNEGCYWSSNYVIGAYEPQGIWQLRANASKAGYEYYAGDGTYYITIAAGEAEGRIAIEQAINNTLNASIFTDKQIYIRYINGNQSLGRFDKVAVKNSQRWAFNYVTAGESYTNMTSIGTTVNIWENGTLTSAQITEQVEGFINQTKS